MTLVEKHRPREWDEVIGNDWIKDVLIRMIENDTTQHMIFVGPPGCGKTTLVRIFASKYLGADINPFVNHPDYREFNASDERGIDVIRSNKVKKYCYTRSSTPGKKRIIVFEEADGFTYDSQRGLRALAENCQEYTIMIFLMNHIEMIKEDALISRCVVFKCDPQPPEKLKEYFLSVANKEEIKFASMQYVDDIINFAEYRGDFRRTINDTLQKLLGVNKLITEADLPWIYEHTYRDLVRQIVANKKNASSLFWSIYRKKFIDPIIFIRELFKEIENDEIKVYARFELAKTFAEVEFRIKNGADDMIQLSYLMKAIEAL